MVVIAAELLLVLAAVLAVRPRWSMPRSGAVPPPSFLECCWRWWSACAPGRANHAGARARSRPSIGASILYSPGCPVSPTGAPLAGDSRLRVGVQLRLTRGSIVNRLLGAKL